MQPLGASNASLVQKEHSAQQKDNHHTICVLMELIQIKKAWVIVKYVMQASGVQVLEWRHLKNALMEHTATQLVLDIVFCVQKVIGEVLGISTYWPQICVNWSFINSSIHDSFHWYNQLVFHRHSTDITWLSNQAIRTCCLIWSYVLTAWDEGLMLEISAFESLYGGNLRYQPSW